MGVLVDKEWTDGKDELNTVAVDYTFHVTNPIIFTAPAYWNLLKIPKEVHFLYID